jgi:mono/diheme cytochrome c family protein
MTGKAACGAAALAAALCTAVWLQSRQPALAADSDPAAPPLRLADTGLYAGGDPSAIDPRNRAFAPQYPLWSDGLTKRRWVYLPPGTVIDASDEYGWEFPAGTRFWKEFSRDGRRIETRFLWKVTPDRWIAVSYAWNDEGTEATRADDGVPAVVEVAPGRRHSIPSRQDCAACHGSERMAPLGFTALQLSTDRDPNAIHGEPLRPGSLTLETLVEDGRLANARADLLSNPPRIRAASADTRAVLGYLAANCGACHNGRGEIAALGPVIRPRDLVEDGDGVARTLFGHPTRWQIPGRAEGSVLVSPGEPDLSAIVARMRSRSPSSQMPPLGTVVRDQEAVEAMARWIAAAGNSDRHRIPD